MHRVSQRWQLKIAIRLKFLTNRATVPACQVLQQLILSSSRLSLRTSNSSFSVTAIPACGRLCASGCQHMCLAWNIPSTL